MILGATSTRGPSVDVNQFQKTLKPAAQKYTIEHILADAGYDSESNHRYAREECHITSTIPPKAGRPTLTPKPCKGKYRELMRTNFDKETYGQRWQVATVFGEYLASAEATVCACGFDGGGASDRSDDLFDGYGRSEDCAWFVCVMGHWGHRDGMSHAYARLVLWHKASQKHATRYTSFPGRRS